MRRLTISLRPALMSVAAVLALPILIGLGAKWSARTAIDQLRSSNAMLSVENGSYRAATGELTAQIQSLESVINDLGARAQLGGTPLQLVSVVVKQGDTVAMFGKTRSNAAADTVGGASDKNAAGHTLAV